MDGPGAGDYAAQVYVRSAGSTAPYEAYAGSAFFTVSAGLITVVDLTSNVAFPAAPETSVTWTARAARGATPLEYQFMLYRQSTNTWTTARAYATSPTWTWTPSAADGYAVQVWVRVGRPAKNATTRASRTKASR